MFKREKQSFIIQATSYSKQRGALYHEVATPERGDEEGGGGGSKKGEAREKDEIGKRATKEELDSDDSSENDWYERKLKPALQPQQDNRATRDKVECSYAELHRRLRRNIRRDSATGYEGRESHSATPSGGEPSL